LEEAVLKQLFVYSVVSCIASCVGRHAQYGWVYWG